MKKKILVLTILLLIFLSGCTKSSIEKIGYKKVNDKISNKENFILEVVQDGCSHCEKFTPKFEKILDKYKLKAFKINLSDLNEKENKEFKDKYSIEGTPTTIFFEKGIENSIMFRIEGNINEKNIIEKLKDNGYIKSEEN